MTQRRAVLAAAGGAVALVCVAVAGPDVASAHGLVGRQDLPIPRWLFAWAAAVVLIVSFVGLAVLWPRPRLEDPPPGRRLLRLPAEPLEVLGGVVGVAAFAGVVYAGLAGTQTATANLAPTTIYVIFWVGIPVASALFGDVFRLLNPWRAVARAVAWVARRGMGDGLPEPLAYPEWLGRWPAAIGILAFAWVELIYANRDAPDQLAVMALAYAATQLVGMSLFGIEPWSRRADAFGVYFGLFARLSPLRWTDGRLELRRPLSGVAALDVVPGTVALLCVMIGTTSFDGFSNGPTWSSLAPHIQSFFASLGLSSEHALEAAFTVGLLGVVGVISACYRLGILGMRTVDPSRSAGELARRFVGSLVPIALAYVVAHYFSLLAYQGQAVAYLASDPLGDGSNLLGTASSTIDYGVITSTGIWYVQVAALVLGHAAGLALAHDRALVLYRRPSEATRSQYWMLAVMVAFTSLGLWLLSAQAQ
jgi:hypothetical protein